MSCEIWPNDDGPCGAPEVERLWWMDHPGPPGLGLCAVHLAEYVGEALLG
jgi:hypothetical protein